MLFLPSDSIVRFSAAHNPNTQLSHTFIPTLCHAVCVCASVCLSLTQAVEVGYFLNAVGGEGQLPVRDAQQREEIQLFTLEGRRSFLSVCFTLASTAVSLIWRVELWQL